MGLINKASLAKTVDDISDALFFQRTIPKADREKAAKWLAARQGLPRSYAGLIAPTDNDFKHGIRLFTGERLSSIAGISHVLGEEGCRALILLGTRATDVKSALRDATTTMLHRLGQSQSASGIYCCGTCSVSLWRHLAVKGLDKQEQRLKSALKYLKARRNDAGRWQAFPFYYTLLALSEIELPAATRELLFAAPACERALKRLKAKDRYTSRKQHLLKRVLALC